MTALFLGVDGGGTKTEFVCIDADANERARTTTGTTYHLQVGLAEAGRRIEQGIATICAQVAITPADLTYAFFGLPAYGEDGTADPEIAAACGRILGHDRYECGNDMVCGWAGSLGCEDGINIVAGTGSIGYGERQDRRARAGGWGEVFGDEGSAYWIALQGLNAFSRMSDGRSSRGPLHQLITDALALDADLELCERIMGPQAMTREAVAALAPLVGQAADEGDAAAAAILARAGDELASLAITLRDRLDFGPHEPVPISWSGGVLANEARVRERFAEQLRRRGAFTFTEPRYPPALGAALYARRLSQVHA